MAEQEISPKLKAELDHLGGHGVVVEYVYADGKGTRQAMDVDSPENEAWQDAAFTNGPPLIEIRIRFDPKACEELLEAASKEE